MHIVFHESYYSVIGGAQNSLRCLLAGIKKDADISIILTHNSSFADSLRESGYHVFIHTPPNELQTFGGAILKSSTIWKSKLLFGKVLPYNLLFYKWLKTNLDPDVLVFNTGRSSLLLFFQRYLVKSPLTVTYLRSELDLGPILKWGIINSSNKFIAVSNTVAEVYGLHGNKVSVVHNGIPVCLQDEINFPGRKNRVNKTLITIGNVLPYKGHNDLIHAFALVEKYIPKWNMNIVGSLDNTEYVKSLRSLIQAYGLEQKIELTGYKNNIDRYLLNSDLYVLPSHVEGFPRSLLEAMSYGLPIVATNVSGVPEILEDADGLIVEKMNVNSLAEGIVKGITALDENPYYGCNNRFIVFKRFSVEKMCTGFMNSVRLWLGS